MTHSETNQRIDHAPVSLYAKYNWKEILKARTYIQKAVRKVWKRQDEKQKLVV